MRTASRPGVVMLGVVWVSLALAGIAAAQDHTLVLLSHSNHIVYELDPATGRILHEFVAPDQPHEGAITSDGATIFASVPAAGLVEILDARTFAEKGRIETEYFKRPPQVRRPSRDGAPPAPPNTSASPHGLALNTDNSKLYIGIENAEVPGVVVYDVKSGRVLKKIDLLLRGGHYLQIQPATDKLYYPHRTDNRVVVIDTKTDRIVKIVPVEGGPVGVVVGGRSGAGTRKWHVSIESVAGGAAGLRSKAWLVQRQFRLAQQPAAPSRCHSSRFSATS